MTEVPHNPIRLFDRAALRRARERAAPGYAGFDFLHREAAMRLAERLEEVRRDFPLALALGPGAAAALSATGRAGAVLALEPSPRLAAAGNRPSLAAEEDALPLAEGSLDLVFAASAFHWVNDLPGALLQLRRALKPDGLLLGVMFGGETLRELREALLAAEAAATGGASPRVAPFAEVRDTGGLLQRAGFALPMADMDRLTVTYADAFALMRDLRGMGEANAAAARPRAFTRRSVLIEAARLYHDRHADAEGRIAATFQLVYMTGWAPHPGQPRALKPGSAAAKLADALDTSERGAGVPVRENPAGGR